jgi:hypothetical protein
MSYLLPPFPDTSSTLLNTYYAYAVSYRFTGPPEAYEDFYTTLKNYDAWFNYTPNFWIVVTKIPMSTVASQLRSKIRTSDWLMVMPAKGPVDGWLPKAGWEWLNSRLMNEW